MRLVQSLERTPQNDLLPWGKRGPAPTSRQINPEEVREHIGIYEQAREAYPELFPESGYAFQQLERMKAGLGRIDQVTAGVRDLDYQGLQVTYITGRMFTGDDLQLGPRSITITNKAGAEVYLEPGGTITQDELDARTPVQVAEKQVIPPLSENFVAARDAPENPFNNLSPIHSKSAIVVYEQGGQRYIAMGRDGTENVTPMRLEDFVARYDQANAAGVRMDPDLTHARAVVGGILSREPADANNITVRDLGSVTGEITNYNSLVTASGNTLIIDGFNEPADPTLEFTNAVVERGRALDAASAAEYEAVINRRGVEQPTEGRETVAERVVVEGPETRGRESGEKVVERTAGEPGSIDATVIIRNDEYGYDVEVSGREFLQHDMNQPGRVEPSQDHPGGAILYDNDGNILEVSPEELASLGLQYDVKKGAISEIGADVQVRELDPTDPYHPQHLQNVGKPVDQGLYSGDPVRSIGMGGP